MRVGLAILCITIFGCQNSPEDSEPQPKEPIGNILVDPYVSQVERDRFAQALSFVESLDYSHPDPELVRLMGPLKNKDLRKWLEERVHILLARDFDFRHRAFYENQYYAYDFPNEWPNPESQEQFALESPKIMMTNVGTGLYISGKRDGRLIALDISRLGWIRVTSPRVGVLKIGDDFYPDLFKRLNRVGLLFLASMAYHEAKHSDGNRKTLGFTHTKCPDGFGDLSNHLACDKSSNGAYAFQAAFLRTFSRGCVSCSPAEHEALEFMSSNFQQRVLGGATEWDDRPEGSW